MRRPAIIGLAAMAVAAAVALALGAGVWLSNDGGPGPGQAVAQQEHRWTLADARAFTDFPLYWVGEEYQGLRLDEVKRVKGDPPPGKVGYPQDFVTFLYDDGRCVPTPRPTFEPADEWSCALPLTIRIDRACLYPPGLFGPESIGKLAVRRGALVLDEADKGLVRAWSGDVLISVSVNMQGLTAAQVFDDLMALNPAGPGPRAPLPAGPAKESVTALDDNQVFLAGGTCQ